MADKKETCSVYVEDPDRGTVIVLRIGQGDLQSLWTVPGGMMDEEKDPREQAKMIAEEELDVEIELYPFHQVLEYPGRVSHVFKGRLVGASPEPGEVYDEIRNISYDFIFNLNLVGSVSADLKRLDGDFFRVYTEQF